MNVTENYMLQQMQQMAANMASTLPQTGSNGKDQSFQDMMARAGQDSADTDTGVEQPVQEKPADTTAARKEPQPRSKEKDAAKNQELSGDPNAMQYAVDPFRPEIVDVSQEELAAGEAVETDVPAGPIPVKFVEVTPTKQLSLISADRRVVPTPVIGARPRPEVAELPVVRPVLLPQGVVQKPVQEAAPEGELLQEAVQQMAEPQEEAAVVQQPEIVEVEVEEVPKASGEKTEDETGGTQGEAAQLNQQPVFREVEAAPVKVAERYDSVDTQAPDMDEKLAAAIRQAADDGAQRIQLTLNPANLGRVTVEMVRDAGGALQVALHVVSGKAEQLLGQHLDGLRTALAAYGQGQEVKVEVQRNQPSPEQQSQQGQHQANPDGHNGQNQQRQHRQDRQQERTGDFLQKLRLGLFEDGMFQ